MHRSKLTLKLRWPDHKKHPQKQSQKPESEFRAQGWLYPGAPEDTYLQAEMVGKSPIPLGRMKSPGLSITESEQRQLMIRMEELARIEGLRENPSKIKIPSTTQALIDSKAAGAEVLKKDGTVSLTQDWDIGDSRSIRAGEIRARDSYGLKLHDDDGNGVLVQDGGYVGIGTTDPGRRLDVLEATNPQLRLTSTEGSVYTDLQTDSSGHFTIDPTGGQVKVDAIMDFTATMGNSSKDPTSTAPDDWIEVKISGTTGYIPWYTA